MEQQNIENSPPAMAAVNKKDSILDKLNKRNKDRQNYLETKLEQRSLLNQEEDADYFAQSFTDRAKQIDYKLENLQSNYGNLELTRLFAGINNDIQELQRYLSQSTMFLPDYNIKAFQNCLNELQSRSEDARQKLMPKKKFGFNSKKTVIKSDPNPQNFANKVNSAVEEKLLLKPCLVSAKQFDWTIDKRRNEHIVLMGSEVDAKDITMANLDNCLIEIQGHPGSLQISNAQNCIVLSGPISRSLFAENCQNCTLVVACQQLRLHTSRHCKLWLHVTCRAIIEDCSEIEIGAYNYEYSGQDCDFKKSGLDSEVNNYRDIADFNWLSPDQPSPNWKLMDNRCNLQEWDEIKEKYKELNKKL